MDCLDDQVLKTLVGGQSSSATEDACVEHLDQCSKCQRRLEQLVGEFEPPFTQGIPSASAVAQESQHPRELTVDELESFYRVPTATNLEAEDSALEDSVLMDDPAADLLSPADGCMGMFAHYRVLEILGRGGMGIVFKAIDPDLDRVVAIKVLAPQLAASETARQRFVKEARAIARLEHANVVGVHQVAQHAGLPYIVMACVEGTSLDKLIEKQGRLSVEASVAISMQVARALAAADEAGLIHRDIKPGNLLIEVGSGTVKVSDFGLARAAEEGGLTRSGFVAGTPQYMSPEQARGEKLDSRSDLYSLGVVIYTMLAGTPPFTAEQPLAVLQMVASASATPINQVCAEVPDWLANLIASLMAKRPEERIQSAEELLRRISAKESPELVRGSQGKSEPMFGSAKQLLALAIFGFVLGATWMGSSHLAAIFGGSSLRSDDSGRSMVAGCLVRLENGKTLNFVSINDAIEAAQPGSEIVLNSEGPYVLEGPVSLTSIAVKSTSPSGSKVELFDSRLERGQAIVEFHGDTMISGLVFDTDSHATVDSPSLNVVDGDCRILNCQISGNGTCVKIEDDASCEIENSILVGQTSEPVISLTMTRDLRCVLHNCLIVGRRAVEAVTPPPTLSGGELVLRNNTIVSDFGLCLSLGKPLVPRDLPLRTEARGNVFQSRFLAVVDGVIADSISMLDLRSQRQFAMRIAWRGDQNLFALSDGYCGFMLPSKNYVPGRNAPTNINAWRGFCDGEGEKSKESATSVLRVIKKVGELDVDQLVYSDFELANVDFTQAVGVDHVLLGPDRRSQTR